MNDFTELKQLIEIDPARSVKEFHRLLKTLDGDRFARFNFIRGAAILGIDDALQYVVAAYEVGDGVEPDRTKALAWMRKSVDDGKSIFLFDLACCYRDGDGTAPDRERFRMYMTQAAERGDVEAMFELAITYLDPDFGPPSIEQAIHWTNEMAGKGSPSALIQLARRYGDGDGVDKNDDLFLSYAEQAVDKARSRLKSKDAAREDWTYEDLPQALAVLAEAMERGGKDSEARRYNKAAAEAAEQAITMAENKGHDVGQLLPEIMLRILPQFKNKDGSLRKGYADRYFGWLARTCRAIELHACNRTEIASDLADAIFQLGLAYQNGVGTAASRTKAEAWIKYAADFNHGRAAFVYAVEYLKGPDSPDFGQYIDVAANANDMDAMLAQQLISAGLKGKSFWQALKALQALRKEVIAIRNDKHRVNDKETSRGIAHYTDGGALASMLSGEAKEGRNVVRLSSTVYVNDPTEGLRLWKFEPKSKANPLQAFFHEVNDKGIVSWQGKDFHVFIGCFSLQCDSLNLWRFYGRDGKGLSIVSPRAVFNADSGDGMLRGPWAKRSRMPAKLALYRVRYDNKSVQETLDRLAQALKPLEKINADASPEHSTRLREIGVAVLFDLLYLYKDKEYEDEREVRAIEARTLGDPEIKTFQPFGKHYAKLYLETGALLFQEIGSKIIIGPKVEEPDAVELDLRYRLAQKGWANTCVVERSVTKYR